MSDKFQASTNARKQREQAALLEQLRKTPIVQYACEKVGVSRATFYRWKTEDEFFAKAAAEALAEGTELVSDLAESRLLTAMRDGNLGAVMYWLKHRNPNYNARLVVTAKVRNQNEPLTQEQRDMIERSIAFASLDLPTPEHEEDDDV